MSGIELAIASGAGKALYSGFLSQKVVDFFSTWKLDTSLLDKLEMLLNSVEALLSDAEYKLIEVNTRVENWVQKARFAIYDAEDLLDEILADVPGSNKVRSEIIDHVESNNSFKTNVKSKFKDTARAIHPFKKTLEEELSKIIERLQFIAAHKDDLGLKEKREVDSYRKGRLSTSFDNEASMICGRSEAKRTIMHLLNSREGNDDAFRVIPIVGLGGIGKTTLACMVFHEYESLKWSSGRRHDNNLDPCIFEMKGWACVSDVFDATHVVKSLLESLTGRESKVDKSFELLRRELMKKLQDKRFLVVLDDLWSEDPRKWDVLRTSFLVGAPGSRVIVTTRSKIVARIVSTSQNFFYELDMLSREESWSLFEKIVFRDGNSSAYPILKDIGRKIVSRCKGLPLAVKMIGGLLLSKGNDENEWRGVLDSKIWESTKIIPSLRLSYYHLPLGVQNCFAYCSIFPKDYTFSMEEMVMLWVGEGLLEKFCESSRYEDVARTYFTHLCSKFFIQESDTVGSEFVMHDLVHDLALHVSRGLCVDLRGAALQSRRLSYIQGKDESLLKNMSGTKLSHLRTFLPLREDSSWKGARGIYFNNKLLGDLLTDFKLLRVLSLGGYAISKLPNSVGDMKLLRYLDLSGTEINSVPNKICRLYNLQILLLHGCQNLTRVPADICNLVNLRHLDLSWTDIDCVPDKICRLHNLQNLLLSGCWKIKRLPAELCNLVNLRHLNVDNIALEKMPDGIGRLTNIRTISKFVIGKGKSKQMRDFKELLNWHVKLDISGLNNVDDREDVAIAGFNRKEYIEELVLDWELKAERNTDLDEEVLDAIEAHKNLKRLSIQNYGGKRLSDWIVGVAPSYTDLVSLSIDNCFNCEALPSLGSLPFLKDLSMEGLECLEMLGAEFYGDSSTPFPALKNLILKNMQVLKRWCFPDGDRVGFQTLKDLHIENCGELGKIACCFPSLIQLRIDYCLKLIALETRDDAGAGSSSVTTFGSSVQSMYISDCDKLQEIPKRFANLVNVDIRGCPQLVSLPRLQHVRELTMKDVSASLSMEAAIKDCRDEVLEELNIESSLSELVSADVNRFTSLKRLDLKIPHWGGDEDGGAVRLPPNLSELKIDCVTLNVPTNILTHLSTLSCLTYLDLFCRLAETFPDVKLPCTLEFLTIAYCNDLRTTPDRFLSDCSKSLQKLVIFKCRNLVSLPSNLSTLKSLHTLRIHDCSIRQFPAATGSGLHYLDNLSYLSIFCCPELESLPGAFHATATLQTLLLRQCPNLRVAGDGLPANLRKLEISDCGKMKPVVKTMLSTLASLTELHLQEFLDISSLDSCLPESIRTLTICTFPHLRSLSGVLPTLKNLRRLQVDDCPLVNQKSWS